MRIANQDGRLVLIEGERCLDVSEASDGRFPADPVQIFDRWPAFAQWAGRQTEFDRVLAADRLGPVNPAPRQVFGVGVNYRSHAEEVGWPLPEVPMIFTKFPSAISGPGAVIEIPGPRIDWEVELVVVIGSIARNVARQDAWSHVAGLTVGQDISDRDLQKQPKDRPMFSLGKSRPGFAPIGPAIATPDEFTDPNAIDLSCAVNGEEVQRGCTDDLIFDVPTLVAYLSEALTLLPGDLIFTGTPSGVGALMSPPRYLCNGDTVTSWMAGVGSMTQTFIDKVR